MPQPFVKGFLFVLKCGMFAQIEEDWGNES
jgi:hypothetical protein